MSDKLGIINMKQSTVWDTLVKEAKKVAAQERILSKVLTEFIFERENLSDALGWRLAARLVKSSVPESDIRDLIRKAFEQDRDMLDCVESDLIAVMERDPACNDFLSPFLYFKGFQALSCYRVANFLWKQERRDLALYLQSLVAVVYSVDIHPAATIGKGILLDHATSFVAGETTVIEDDVSILHEVTLGVLIGAGAKILGNVEIGEGARVGASSVVLNDVPAHVSVAGVPAKEIGKVRDSSPALGMDHNLLEMREYESGGGI
jgi:serine O-acetyltransferase